MKDDVIFGSAEPRCEYCEYGQFSHNGDKILCVKKGILDPGFSCRKFKYDPLKKIPREPPRQTEFSEDDFKL